jgi:hypothetical protein
MRMTDIRRECMTVDAKWRCLLLLPFIGLIAACASLQRDPRLMALHPADAELGKHPPTCTECHDAKDENFAWQQFNHTPNFGKEHKRQAKQHEQVCSMCHGRNYCNDCHANSMDMKPSLKNPHRTSRKMPHRGDYVAKHRIDGRVNPTSCVRCHRNPKTSKSCQKCHG